MNSIDEEDKLKNVIKYGKYVVLVLLIVLIFFIVKGCGVSYSKIEKEMVKAAKNYVQGNNTLVNSESYIEIGSFDIIEGTELCNNGSGVIVTNKNNSLEFKPFLKCPDYTSKVINNKSKYIKLNGDEVTILNTGEIFNDSYYTIIGELLNGYVEIRGEAKTTPGIYNIYYDVYYPDDSGNAEEVENFKLIETLVRKVIVIKNDKNLTVSGLVNSEEPYLKLNGDTNITISKGSKYSDPSYTAYDYVDGKISRQVQVTGEVDPNKVGNYVVMYTVTNSRGKTAFATRNVQVVTKSADLEIKADKEIEANHAIITVEVIGSGYDYIKKMDGEKEFSRKYSFTATENKIYSIEVYDAYGTRHVKEVGVSEIDDVKPTGTCKAITMYNKTIITAEATDDKGIAGFNFRVNGKESGFITDKAYEFDVKGVKPSVVVKDVSGNNAYIDCTIEEGNIMYVNEKGYNCLYPFTCFKQGDYSDWHYSFCSTETCGKISQRGCSLTSVTTIVSGFGVKDKNGELYTPYTMLSDVYDPIACKHKMYCSGSTASYRAFEHLGLKVTMNENNNAYYFSRDKIPIILDHLKKGGAVLIRAKGPGIYVVSKGHIMALLGVNEKDEVYLFDPNAKYGETNGKGPVNTFISTEYLVKGQVTWFQLVGK